MITFGPLGPAAPGAPLFPFSPEGPSGPFSPLSPCPPCCPYILYNIMQPLVLNPFLQLVRVDHVLRDLHVFLSVPLVQVFREYQGYRLDLGDPKSYNNHNNVNTLIGVMIILQKRHDLQLLLSLLEVQCCQGLQQHQLILGYQVHRCLPIKLNSEVK